KIRQLRSSDPSVRAAAIRDFAEPGDHQAVAALIELLCDKDRDVRVAATQVLAMIGDPDTVGPLITAMIGEACFDARHEMVMALGEIAAPAAVEQLLLTLDGSAGNAGHRQLAAWALKTLGPEHLSPEQRAMVNILLNEWSDLPELGEAAVGPLVDMLEETTPRVQREAIETLTRIEDPAAISALQELLRHPDDGIRRMASQVAVQFAWERIGDAHLAMAAVTLERWQTVICLGPAAIDTLVEVIRTSDSPVQQRAIQALGEIGDPRAVPALVDASTHADVAVRQAATAALEQITDQSQSDANEGATALGCDTDGNSPPSANT
ncbi:MAG: HEAT repeat domain-containing protein, partial [Phycisphaerales bacterium]